MKEIQYIEDLIAKFNRNDISPDEMALLLDYFKSHEPTNELMEVYQRVWESASASGSSINSEAAYSGIMKGIDQEKIPVRKLTAFTVIKYAAIFILAFGMSWFIHNAVNKSESHSVSYQHIEVPYGSKSKIELPDGSIVTLNSGSRLRYRNNFGSDSRIVFLEGEAFFDVKKSKTVPFYVNAAGIKIKVLGTSFNVKAYPEEKTIETTLVTGRIEIYKSNTKDETQPLVTLNPSQKAIYERTSEAIALTGTEKAEETNTSVPEKIQVQKDINPEQSTAWKDNWLVFDNEPFVDLITRMERWYDVEIELNHPGLKEARFSGRFDKETIEQALKALTIVTPFQYEIKKNKIFIYKQ